MNSFLQTGDVIELKEGMEVYTKLPSKFVYSNRPMSMKLTETKIEIGQIKSNKIDIVEVENDIVKGIKDTIYFRLGLETEDQVIEAFVQTLVAQYKEESFDTNELKGEYVVTLTANEGGGHGHGIHDTYPDGYKVVAKRLKDGQYDKDGYEISFYQSGCFTAMIEPTEIQPIRKLELRFV